jgi:preprotein translocase subunit SecE
VSMNREQRRLLQRQGQMTEEGLPATRRPDAPERKPSRPAPGAPSRRTSPRQFMHEVNVELRKVAWPTKAETANYSMVVFIAVSVMMGLIFLLDLGFSNFANFLFK